MTQKHPRAGQQPEVGRHRGTETGVNATPELCRAYSRGTSLPCHTETLRKHGALLVQTDNTKPNERPGGWPTRAVFLSNINKLSNEPQILSSPVWLSKAPARPLGTWKPKAPPGRATPTSSAVMYPVKESLPRRNAPPRTRVAVTSAVGLTGPRLPGHGYAKGFRLLLLYWG